MVKKLWRYVKPFSSDTGTLRTDGQTDRFAISISRVSILRCWRAIKIAVFTTFLFPWGRPWGNHTKCCMDGKRIRCLQIVSQHVPIYLPVSQLFEPQLQKIAIFTYRSPHFCFPGDAPAIITQYVAWMERQFNACQTSCSMYLSIFNGFRVIRCLSQCVSPKIAIFTIFLFPLGTPLGQSR